MEDRRLVTLEQALTGVEEGNWIEMRGFVRDLMQTNGLVRFDLSTSSGEFQAWTPASQSFDPFKGSIIRVRGVCSAVSNARHQLTGIQIWTPDQKYIQTEEPAPYDLFAVPLRSLASLRRFNMESALNQRIRTSGTVVLHVPGRYLYVQDGADSVFALSQQTNALQPGDRVEVVGFPGEEGQRIVLREAVYRRLSGGREPIPVQLSMTNSVNVMSTRSPGESRGSLDKQGGKRRRNAFAHPDKRFRLRGRPQFDRNGNRNETANPGTGQPACPDRGLRSAERRIRAAAFIPAPPPFPERCAVVAATALVDARRGCCGCWSGFSPFS